MAIICKSRDKNIKSFCFVHIYKTGGNAIIKTLQKQLQGKDVNFNLRFTSPHCSLRDIKDKMINQQINPDNFLFFGFVRNPYDWVYSTYYYIKKSPGHEYYNTPQVQNFNEFVKWLFTHAYKLPKIKFQDQYSSQSAHLISKSGAIELDYVGKMEDFDNDYKYICNQIGLTYHKPLAVNVLSKRDQKSFKGEMSEKSKIMINNNLHDDFINFDYQKL